MKSCVVNKSFLFWKWKSVEHNYKMKLISRFMSSSDTFVVTYKCECGAKHVDHFVTQDDLLKVGITMDILNKITDLTSYRV